MTATKQVPMSVARIVSLLEADGVAVRQVGEAPAEPFSSVTYDSREAAPGALFICKGAGFKREYLESALAAGAAGYLAGEDFGVDAFGLVVDDVRRAMELVADAAYAHPSGDLRVCALTGTKGKTTTAYYLRHVLEVEAAHEGRPSRIPLFSTIVLDDGVTCEKSKLTTPECLELERHLAIARDAGAHEVVMEASSQALKYGRTYGVEFAVGAFLNIGEDHISPIEHPTFEDYFASKLKIFAQSRVGVVNLDADHVDEILAAAKACERVITYSLRPDSGADVRAENLERKGRSIAFDLVTPTVRAHVLLPTLAEFNASNALAAVACAEALGVREESLVEALETVSVPGRAELFDSADGGVVGVVDYAHNGMSLTALLEEVREAYPGREVTAVFGATGGKGVDRRQTMGEAAGLLADRVIATEDDPGPEDPADICEAIAVAVRSQGEVPCEVVLDREEAIAKAVREAKAPAVVVVAGKGADAFMLRRGVRVPCEPDTVLVPRALAALGA